MKNTHTFRAGVARCDISPPEPQLLFPTGMGRLVPTRGVLDPLFVEAIALEVDGRLAFLTTSDLRVIEPDWSLDIRQRIAARTGCDPEWILLSATHNHCSSPDPIGPALVPGRAGQVRPVSTEANLAHQAAVKHICDAFVDACVAAHASLVPSETAATTARLKEPMGENRRMRLSSGTCVNCWGSGPVVPPGQKYAGPAGNFDPTITVLCVRRIGRKKPFAVLTSYNSHPHLYELPYFSGETAGACKRAIQARLPGSVALYAHGTGGDIDLHCVHPIAGDDEASQVQWFQKSAALLGQRFADAVVTAVNAARGYTRPTRIAHEYVTLGGTAEEGPCLRVLNMLVVGNFAFVSMPGELFVEFGFELRRRSPFRHLFLMGYNGSMHCYIPPALAFEQGSYEVMRGPALSPADEVTTHATGRRIVRAGPATGPRIVNRICDMLTRASAR